MQSEKWEGRNVLSKIYFKLDATRKSKKENMMILSVTLHIHRIITVNIKIPSFFWLAMPVPVHKLCAQNVFYIGLLRLGKNSFGNFLTLFLFPLSS